MADYYETQNEDDGAWQEPEEVDPNAPPYYPPPKGAVIDAEGRLLNVGQIENEWDIEDYFTFVSEWKPSWMSSPMEGQSASFYVWPDIPKEVNLKRVDVFELNYPTCQQATADREESRE